MHLAVVRRILLVVFHLTGEGKEKASGDGVGVARGASAATRMVTRLRNPDSKLSQLKSQQVAAAVHEANKGFREGKEVSRARQSALLPLTLTDAQSASHAVEELASFPVDGRRPFLF